MSRCRVGSRESQLAQVQARGIMAQLQAAWPDLDLGLSTFKTTGDKFLEEKLSDIGEKGLFVKELEIALLDGQIDLAVHSLKDMPAELPEHLALVTAGKREDPRDVLISASGKSLAELPENPVIGTSSVRRIAMLKRLRPDVRCENIRGNLQTRLRKLDEGQYDAIVLAAAGIHRLGLKERITQYFHPLTELTPAPGQGLLAIEYRQDDGDTARRLAGITEPEVAAAMTAERTVLETLEAGCHVPVGAHATVNNSQSLHLYIRLLSTDGQTQVEAEDEFPMGEAEERAKRLARQLLEQQDGLL